MQPVVHLFVGYIAYAAYTRAKYGHSPQELPAIAAIVGAAIPDLLDKPLYAADLVPVGRTIGHSLLFSLPLIAAVWWLSRRRNRSELVVAFAVGYLSHVATDIPWHVVSGDYQELGFLLWPVTHMPEYSGVKPLGTVAGLEITTLWLEAVIVVIGAVLWWRDGAPGLEVVRRRLPF